MEITCYNCGGTGEAFDHAKDDWVYPIEDCDMCNGTGKLDYCKTEHHIPDITGMCQVCGEEVVKEVEEYGDVPPELD